ncbi:MAG: formylglycine-generating enzyme family protein [Gammaproteobacteria bacterium]|nr:formylglycine-generating enzyme family protein [Gammaproteobacteria bacterium]
MIWLAFSIIFVQQRRRVLPAGACCLFMFANAATAQQDMVLIPAGYFTMGATLEQQQTVLEFGWPVDWHDRIKRLVRSAKPAHRVYLNSFLIDKFEITNRVYKKFSVATGNPLPPYVGHVEQFSTEQQPAVGVSWFEAAAVCRWMGKRLPTEAEWEKAARGTQSNQYPWGDIWELKRSRTAELIAGHALNNFESWHRWQQQVLKNAELARPDQVGTYSMGASPYGVMDMVGNVWEWVADWYHPNYYASSPLRNPKGPPVGIRKVLRGGGWDVPRVVASTWFREDVFPPDLRGATVAGFRCAKDIADNKEGARELVTMDQTMP